MDAELIGGNTVRSEIRPEIPESRRTALLVIQDDSGQEVIASALRAEQFAVSYARDPYDGFLQFVREPSKLVIVSLDRLKQRDRAFLRGLLLVSPDVKILLLVPEGRREAASRFLEEGAAGLLSMPCYPAEVKFLARALMSDEASDPLTGLPNRAAAQRAFSREKARAGRTQVQSSLGFGLLDLDDFGEINNHHGYAEGDRVLREATRLLKAEFRMTDIFARWGGEEFVVLLNSLPTDQAEAREQACAALNRARRTLGTELVVPAQGGHEERKVTVSGGLALFPHEGGTWEELFRVAEARLKEAKKTKNQIVCGP
jgi:diguanylate cyclase (GGDEF)-like protein